MLTRLCVYFLRLCIRDFIHRGVAVANEQTEILSAFSLTDLSSHTSPKLQQNPDELQYSHKKPSSSTGAVLSQLS